MKPVLSFLCLLLLTVFTHGQDKNALPAVILATEKAKIRALEGKDATVRGLVESTVKGPSGVQILKFKDSEFAVVCFKSYVSKFKDGAPADVFKGRNVEVTGKIEIYKKQDQPQIKLREPSQIKIVSGDDPAKKSKPTGPKGKSKSGVDFRKYFCG